MFSPSRNLVLALATYVVLGFGATLALGDLGDVGFWIVWIPIAAIVVYLPLAGLVWISRRGTGRQPRRAQ